MLPEFRLEAHFSQWEFKARYNLAASDAETLPLADLVALADDEDRRAWDALTLGYIETRGSMRLRETIASTYEICDPGRILCFAGAEEGLYCGMHALLEPGDHAIVTCPNYQSMETIPASICSLSGIPLEEDRGWGIDIDRLRAAIRPNTKLIAVNFPNNPTGGVVDVDALREIIDICRHRGIWLFSDEVYRGLERDGVAPLPQAVDCYDRGISLNVVSKALGLPGLRVGWIASSDERLLARMERIKHYLSICNAGPSELLARIALKARGAILQRNRTLCEENLRRLARFFARHSGRYRMSPPAASCVAYPQYLGEEGVEAHCGQLLQEAGVLLLPASIYRSDLCDLPGDHFRIGYGRSAFDEGLVAWDEFLSRE